MATGPLDSRQRAEPSADEAAFKHQQTKLFLCVFHQLAGGTLFVFVCSRSGVFVRTGVRPTLWGRFGRRKLNYREDHRDNRCYTLFCDPISAAVPLQTFYHHFHSVLINNTLTITMKSVLYLLIVHFPDYTHINFPCRTFTYNRVFLSW